MNHSQLEMAASMDIRFWRTLHHDKCPNCYTPWSEMHPANNLSPHWSGDCVKLGWKHEETGAKRELHENDCREFRIRPETGIERHYREEREERIARQEAEMNRIAAGIAQEQPEVTSRPKAVRRVTANASAKKRHSPRGRNAK